MEIEKVRMNIKCDGSGCKNLATYTILNKKFVFDSSIHLCDACLNELYSIIGKIVVPKNIEPIYKSKGVKNEKN